MPTADSTPSSASANSYADLTTAQPIIDATPNTSAWGTDTDAQELALIYATSMLEAVAYQGTKSTQSQALQWPRVSVRDPDYGQDTFNVGFQMGNQDWGVLLDFATVPKRIVRGCVMLALEIMRAGPGDVWGVDRDINKKSKGVDVLRTDFVDPEYRRQGLRFYPSVWREIYPLTMAATGGGVVRS